MGIFDKFRKKKSTDKEKIQDEALKNKQKTESVVDKSETVLTPDGKLVNAPKKDTKKPKKVKIKKEETGDAYKVLIKPLVTEKGSMLGTYNQYSFEVAPNANKVEIKKAIKKVYGIKPIRVNVMNVSGKKVRYGRTEGRTKNWKKALITLRQGEKIDIQEVI